MTEQTITTTTTTTTTPKLERSTNNTIARLSYDCLISSTKSFVSNFSNLTDDEKLEFKSLSTYIKQLEKCLPSKQSRSVVRVKKTVETPAVVESTETVVETTKTVSRPTEEKVIEPVQTKTTKRTTKKVETSPTAKIVSEVAATAAVVATSDTTVVESTTSKEDDKKPVKKSTQTKTK